MTRFKYLIQASKKVNFSLPMYNLGHPYYGILPPALFVLSDSTCLFYEKFYFEAHPI